MNLKVFVLGRCFYVCCVFFFFRIVYEDLGFGRLFSCFMEELVFYIDSIGVVVGGGNCRFVEFLS